MSVFGFLDPTDARPTFGERIGSVVTAPFRWVGDATGALIGGVGGGLIDAISTPLLILAGMATLLLIVVMVT